MTRGPAPAPVPRPTGTPTRAPAGARTDSWSDAVLAVVGLVLPVVCVGCGRPDRAVCASCRDELDARPLRRRLVAGVRLDAAFAYEGLVRALVLECKLRGRTDVAPALAARFGDLVRGALQDAPGALLVRVPPSRTGARRRGFDPVVLLLRRSRALRHPGCRAPCRRALCRRAPCRQALCRQTLRRSGLRRVRRPSGWTGAVSRVPGAPLDGVAHGQKERTALERVEATVGTLRAHGVAGCDVVVVDDVVTTGVTMAEAVRAVRAAGGRVVRCVALAEVEE